MTKWIRWSGLIGFTVILALLAGFWMFAAAPLIKFSIEKFGSEAVGAKIDVKDVSLGFNPLVLSIDGVDITDKDAPMSNAVSFDRAVADMSLFPLLLGKSIIQDMSLTGVAFGTPREVSGALLKEEKAIDKSKESSNAQLTEGMSEEASKKIQNADMLSLIHI